MGWGWGGRIEAQGEKRGEKKWFAADEPERQERHRPRT